MITLQTQTTVFEAEDIIEVKIPAKLLSQMWAGGNHSCVKFSFDDLRKDVMDHQQKIAQMLHIATNEVDTTIAYFYLIEHTNMALCLVDAIEKACAQSHASPGPQPSGGGS